MADDAKTDSSPPSVTLFWENFHRIFLWKTVKISNFFRPIGKIKKCLISSSSLSDGWNIEDWALTVHVKSV